MKFEPVFLHSQILYLLQYEIKKREQPYIRLYYLKQKYMINKGQDLVMSQIYLMYLNYNHT